ncbi:MAG TPA: DUF5677 domain-containing protein [Streptosporangiaceae bacterium]|nr:DUF5677 domain-containing protein [Streptosporangiaceae bacterium]
MPGFHLFSDEEIDAHAAKMTNDLAAALAAGTPREEALRQMGEAAADLLEDRASVLADHMQQRAPLAAARRQARAAQLTDRWGTALDAYYTVTIAASELGTRCAQRRDEVAAPADSVSNALVLLHARACQTSAEVHALLAAGFPGGAYARYRTLHEIAVTTAVIAEHGRTPEHADLADRYLSHTHIEHWQCAEHYQRSSSRLGWPPVSQETMRALRRERNRLTSRYGKAYLEPYGWAASLIKPKLTFARLEAKANMDVLRYLYATGSHLVHATAHGLALTIRPGQDAATAGDGAPAAGPVTVVVTAGPTTTGLAQPAEVSLNALLDVTCGLVMHGGHPESLDIHVNFLALHELRKRTIRLFDQAEALGPEPGRMNGPAC